MCDFRVKLLLFHEIFIISVTRFLSKYVNFSLFIAYVASKNSSKTKRKIIFQVPYTIAVTNFIFITV